MLDGEAVTVTDGVWFDITCMTIELDSAGLFDTQDKLEVIKHCITSVSEIVLLV